MKRFVGVGPRGLFLIGVVVALAVLVLPGISQQAAAQPVGWDVNQCDDDRDNDADGAGYPGRVNDGCPAVDVAEAGAQCDNAIDDGEDAPADGVVNDGCPPAGTPEEDSLQCGNSLDDDGDTKVNDGCPPVDVAEAGAQCDNAVDDEEDTPADGVINDGCPAVGDIGPPEVEDACANATDDDDLDGKINDGCPPVGVPEAGDQCDNAVDDEEDTPADGVVNDGCPAFDNEDVTAGDNSEAPPGVVGGIADLPDLAGTGAEQVGASADGSGWSVGAYSALAGGLAAAAVAFGGGAWYARRRFIRS